MPLHFARILLFIAALSLAACGGGSSSEVRQPTPADTLNISGIVVDGPIAGARVEIQEKIGNEEKAIHQCGDTGKGTCITTTDNEGRFSFKIRSDADLNNLRIVTIEGKGGIDLETGFSFEKTRNTLSADLSLFSQSLEGISITPVTTLLTEISALLQEDGAERSLQEIQLEAEVIVREALSLPGEDLVSYPFTNPVKHRSMLMVALAFETGQSFEKIADIIHKKKTRLFNATGNNVGAKIDSEKLEEDFAVEEDEACERIYILELDEDIARKNSSEWGNIFQKTSLKCAFQNIETNENIDSLVDQVIEAGGGKIIPLGTLAPRLIAKYVLFHYNLSEDGDYWRPAPNEGGDRILLKEDPVISMISQHHEYEYQVDVALADNELLRTEQQRINYYYKSNISHLYEAEKIASEIIETDYNDEIMVTLVDTKARFGQFEGAKKIPEWGQIGEPEATGRAYLTLARRMIEIGDTAETLDILKRAEDNFKRVIDSKGIAYIESSDTRNLQQLAANYRKIGAEADARQILGLLEQAVPYLNTSNLFGRLIVGTWEIADQYLERGQMDDARPLVDSMLALAERCPPDENAGNRYYRGRIFYLTEAAKRYAQMGDENRVIEIHRTISSIRANDGLQNLTRNETWFYMISLVETLYAVGQDQSAMELALSIPDSYVNSRGVTMSGTYYRSRAMKAVATSIALEEGLLQAANFMNEYIPDPRDKIEAWTYMAGNKGNAYTAQQAIELGFLDIAKQALLHARDLVAGLDESTDRNHYRYAIQWGYVKLADLAWHAQDPDLASDFLFRAQAATEQLTDVEYRVSALVDIAESYRITGDPEEAERLLRTAFDSIYGVATEDAIAMQEMVLDAFTNLHENELNRYIETARQLFTQGTPYPGTEHDELAELEARSLIHAANHLSFFSGTDKTLKGWALDLLDEARQVAEQIYVPATRMSIYITDKATKEHLIEGYTRARELDKALGIARSLPAGNQQLAFNALATIYNEWDDLPHTDLASVDTDRDGKPNFFNPGIDRLEAEAQGIMLDPDSDGDGIPDEEDYRPLYYDEVRR